MAGLLPDPVPVPESPFSDEAIDPMNLLLKLFRPEIRFFSAPVAFRISELPEISANFMAPARAPYTSLLLKSFFMVSMSTWNKLLDGDKIRREKSKKVASTGRI